MFRFLFTASRWQVATYLLGVALFSISFLVFLNSSLSFVITDLIGRKSRVGDAVGTLGFADELVAIFACPFWGLLSDRIGVRTVCVVGYAIVGLSLWTFVQAKNVYPQLLLARLFFSIGGAATSTMVTAVLPTMTIERTDMTHPPTGGSDYRESEQHLRTTDSDFDSLSTSRMNVKRPLQSATSHIAGLVGMFTGLGALMALSVFLPLPVRLQKGGHSPASAVTNSYYIVGAIAFGVSLACFIGLRELPGEDGKSWRALHRTKESTSRDLRNFLSSLPYPKLLLSAISLGFQDEDIGLGYLGGFVARASSVGITLFIPVFVNAYFISSGLCDGNPSSNPAEIKESCRRAYGVASMLAGVSQLVALLCAPIFGYVDGKYFRLNVPLLASAVAGIIGHVTFARIKSPDPGSDNGSSTVFLIMALVGISQIGTIVCSLSILSRAIQSGHSDGLAGALPNASVGVQAASYEEEHTQAEASPLLSPVEPVEASRAASRSHLKGSIAGVYSLSGGLGILLLTKIGGLLFDRLSPNAPFYMLAIFNGLLLLVGLVLTIKSETGRRSRKSGID